MVLPPCYDWVGSFSVKKVYDIFYSVFCSLFVVLVEEI